MGKNIPTFEEFYAQQQEIFRAIGRTVRISDLKHKTDLEYCISNYVEVIDPIIRNNNIIAVSGGYFGDESKGKMVDVIAADSRIKLIIRVNSGENAGHTVKHKDVEFVFHLTPSGILIPEKTCLIGPECVMDPINYLNGEILPLKQAGIDYKKRLFVGNTHIVNPTCKILDFAINGSNNSTLQGMSYIHALKAMKAGIRLDDLFNDGLKENRRLSKEFNFYFGMLKQHELDEEMIYNKLQKFSAETGRKIPQHIYDFLKAKDKAQFLEDLYKKFVVENRDFPERKDINQEIKHALKYDDKILVELAQSYWLSNATEKHWSSSTSAQTHLAGSIASITAINPCKHKIANINVAKTPDDSRIGPGANPSSFVPQDYFSKRNYNNMHDLEGKCLDFNSIQKQYYSSIQENGILKPTIYEDATGKYVISEAMVISAARQFGESGRTTGKPRVTGLFDCLAARQVNDSQGPYLFLSALDRGDHQDFVGLTVAYIYHNPKNLILDSNGNKYKNGDIIRIGDPYPCDNVLRYCHPLIKIMPSWKEAPVSADKFDGNRPLPKNLQNFIGTIEDLTGFTILGIGNGQDSSNVIYLKKN